MSRMGKKPTAKTNRRHMKMALGLRVGKWCVAQSTNFGEIFLARVNKSRPYRFKIGIRSLDVGDYIVGDREYSSYEGAKKALVNKWIDTLHLQPEGETPDESLSRFWKPVREKTRPERYVSTTRDHRLRLKHEKTFAELGPGKCRTAKDGKTGKIVILKRPDGSGPFFQIAMRGGLRYKLDAGEYRKRKGQKGLKGFVYKTTLYDSYLSADKALRDWVLRKGRILKKGKDMNDPDNI